MAHADLTCELLTLASVVRSLVSVRTTEVLHLMMMKCLIVRMVQVWLMSLALPIIMILRILASSINLLYLMGQIIQLALQL